MSTLALVTSQTATDIAPVPQRSKYSADERETIQHYQAVLEAGRYFKLYNAASPYPRLISGDAATEPLPLSFLADDFVSWCREKGRRVPNPSPSPEYLAWPLETVTGTRFVPRGSALVRMKQSRHKYVMAFPHRYGHFR
jgi:hypothetical protein